jgi:hypothetical protein
MMLQESGCVTAGEIDLAVEGREESLGMEICSPSDLLGLSRETERERDLM